MKKDENMECSASQYKSFLDTVQLDMTSMKEMRKILTQEQQYRGVTLRQFMAISEA